MKRGRWQALKSVRRYEKAGRVNQAWAYLDRDDKDRVMECLRAIEDVLIRGHPPPVPPKMRRDAVSGRVRAGRS